MLAASRHSTPTGSPGPASDLYSASRLASRIPVSAAAPASAASSMLSSTPQPPPASQSDHRFLTPVQEPSLSRLAPSVYSHPSVQDPILKSPKSFYQDPQVIVPNRGFNISSSGAYFDTSAISRSQPSSQTDLSSQNDLIAKLTREMKMNGGLSGSSDVESSGSTSTLNNPNATAEKIAALALQAKLTTDNRFGTPVQKLTTDLHNLSNGSNVSSGLSGLNQTSQSLTDTSTIRESQTKDPPPYESPQKDEGKSGRQQEVRKPSLGKPDNLPLLSSLTSTQPDLQPGQTSSVVTSVTSNGQAMSQMGGPVASLGSPDAPHYTQEMVEIIIGENRELKHHLDLSRRRIMKLDNLEKEMMKIHEAYSDLKEHMEKRELLEKSARSKLQAEVLNLTEVNKDLKERHESIIAQVSQLSLSL